MTVHPVPGHPLPPLVTLSRQVVLEEAEAFRAALADYSAAPQPGCPFELDDKAWCGDEGPHHEGRRHLLGGPGSRQGSSPSMPTLASAGFTQ
jgi:hypothetical protein